MNKKRIQKVTQRAWNIIAFLVALCCAQMAVAQELPDDLEADEEAEYYYRMAVQFYGEGRYRESVHEFDRALEFYDDPVMHCNRAAPLMKLEEFRAARRSLITCRDGYPVESQDYAQVDAQAQALRVIVEAVQPRSIEIAREISEGPLQIAAPSSEPVDATLTKDTQRSNFAVAGLVLLGVGVGLGGAAAVIDIRSAELVDELRRQSGGGEGTSAAAHREVQQEVLFRQRVFWSLAGSGLGAATLGLGVLGWDFLRSPDGGQRAVVEVGAEGFHIGWSLRF